MSSKELNLTIPTELVINLTKDNSEQFADLVNKFFKEVKRFDLYEKNDKGIYVNNDYYFSKFINCKITDKAVYLNSLSGGQNDVLSYYRNPKFAFIDNDKLYLSQASQRVDQEDLTGKNIESIFKLQLEQN